MQNLLIPTVLVNEGGQERSYDIYSRLLRDRIIMINDDIEPRMAGVVISQMLYLQSEDSTKDIHMYINSPGGYVTAGLAITDTMDAISCPVNTYCMGQCASMGAVILSSGTKGKRFALRNSRIMIHSVSSGAEGKIEDMKLDVNETDRLNDLLAHLLAENCGKPFKKIKKTMERDFYLSAEEAKEFGLIDEVMKKVTK